MTTLLDRLIAQLDSLVPFLALEHEEFFVVLDSHFREWYKRDSGAGMPQTLNQYKTQVAHAGFILGYSFFEAFLADLMRAVYRAQPKLLPKDKKLGFSELLDLDSYDSVLDCMIEKEVMAVCYRSIDEIGKHFTLKLNLEWPDSRQLVEASLIRNCIIHNNAVVDPRLARVSGRDVDNAIALSAEDVHEFGLEGRRVARKLVEDAEERYVRRGSL